jgi:hypothetical protein
MENWGTKQPKKSLFQRMKNKFSRKPKNQTPKKSFTQKFKNMFTRKKVAPMPNKPTINNMRYKTNNNLNSFMTNASNPEVEEKIQKISKEIEERYLENHPRTGFTAPLARKSRKSNK